MREFPTQLLTLTGAEADAIAAVRSGEVVEDDEFPAILRRDGSTVELEPLFHVLKIGAGKGFDITASDAWFSPRLHWSVRLSRLQASDPGMWEWLAYRLADRYVVWRWGQGGSVASNRYKGSINKQAFARLWWGAELFRNGDDYLPVELLFANQDFPNSYIHRVFARNRPLAVATVLELSERAHRAGGKPTSDFINDVARGVNLWLAPIVIDPITSHWRAEVNEYLKWADEDPGSVPPTDLPPGPRDGRVPDQVIENTRRLVGQICDNLGP